MCLVMSGRRLCAMCNSGDACRSWMRFPVGSGACCCLMRCMWCPRRCSERCDFQQTCPSLHRTEEMPDIWVAWHCRDAVQTCLKSLFSCMRHLRVHVKNAV